MSTNQTAGKTNKKFVGYTKQHVFSNGDAILKISFNEADMKLLKENQNEKGYVNLNLQNLGTDKPYLVIDDWKPTPRTQAEAPAGAGDDLPF